MTIDDPFAEPDDSERTVIRPNPGGRRPVEPAPGLCAAAVGNALRAAPAMP